jgi:dTDP-4-amino-4,6-dideoxygalactose transaminase
MIPFLDLEAATEEIRPDLDEALARVLSSGWFVLGPEVQAFEAEFAAFVDTSHCVGVGNGLDAIELTLRALGVRAGDEVIVPSNTYIATWLAVTRVGAIVVPVEPDLMSYNIDPNRTEAAITPRTRAIIAVHLYGQPADLESLSRIARRRGIWLIEDAAQAHGAMYQHRPVGGLADAAAWSFYPTKNLGSLGDGGAITTNNSDVASKVRLLRNYGSRVKYVNEIVGSNSRLDELQAAALRVKLPHLQEWNRRRRRVAERYRSELADVPICLPTVAEDGDHVWHLFVIRSSERDRLQQYLTDCGVQTLLHYPIPPHLQEAYRDLGMREGSLPVAEAIHRECLSLPIGPHMSDSQVDAVIKAVRSFQH